MGISEKILDAIDILIDASLNNAKYDKTIEAQIVSCINADKGQYKCKYQDFIFSAYTPNNQMQLQNEDNVYILISENDINKQKIIIGKRYY